jgi:hypothetical protein
MAFQFCLLLPGMHNSITDLITSYDFLISDNLQINYMDISKCFTKDTNNFLERERP